MHKKLDCNIQIETMAYDRYILLVFVSISVVFICICCKQLSSCFKAKPAKLHNIHEFFIGDSNVTNVHVDVAPSNIVNVQVDPMEMQLSYQVSRPLTGQNRISGVGAVLGDTPVIYTNELYYGASNIHVGPLKSNIDLGDSNACSGHWTGSNCVIVGDVCTSKNPHIDPNRVSRWTRDSKGIFICEETNDCSQGKWDGKKCIVEGDPCESPVKDSKRLYEYSTLINGITCLPSNKCVDGMWFSESQNACLHLGERCYIGEQSGIVGSDHKSSPYCQLDMVSAEGYKLSKPHEIVDSEQACYELCSSRRGGCGAYSYVGDTNECATTGFLPSFAETSCNLSKLVYTTEGNIHPVYTVDTNGDSKPSVTVKWEPFNVTDFSILYSSEVDMSNVSSIPSSGSIISGGIGDTLFFEPTYSMLGVEENNIPPKAITFTNRSRSYKKREFSIHPETGPYHESFRVKWGFDLEDDMTLMIKFPTLETPIQKNSHGYMDQTFTIPGVKRVEYWVYKKSDVDEGKDSVDVGQIVDTGYIFGEVVCSPSRFPSYGGECVRYEVRRFDANVTDTKVRVLWDVRTGQGIDATFEVNGSVYKIDPPMGYMDLDIGKPGIATFRIILREGRNEIYAKSFEKNLSCSNAQTVFTDGRCVEKCPSNPKIGEWVYDARGSCELSCPGDYEINNKLGECIAKKGVACKGPSEIENGKWLADGIGGCEFVCDKGYESVEGECYKQCDVTKPKRSEFYWDSKTKQCSIRCESKNFTIENDECVETCKDDGPNHEYIRDNKGFCRISCKKDYEEVNGECVQTPGIQCGKNVDWKTDGLGGCVLQCGTGFEADEILGECKKVCPVGTQTSDWVHGEKGECVQVCKIPEEYTLWNGDCVYREGRLCENGGVADGRGECTLTCSSDEILYKDLEGRSACVPIFKAKVFDAVALDEYPLTVRVTWDFDVGPKTNLKLEGRSIASSGHRDFTFDDIGDKEFRISIHTTDNSKEKVSDLVAIATTRCPSNLSANALTKKCENSLCGVQPRSGYGKREIRENGVCELVCYPGYVKIGDACYDAFHDVGMNEGDAGFTKADAIMASIISKSVYGNDRSSRVAFSVVDMGRASHKVDSIQYKFIDGRLTVVIVQSGRPKYLTQSLVLSPTSSYVSVDIEKGLHFSKDALNVWIVPHLKLVEYLHMGSSHGYPQALAVNYNKFRRSTLQDGIVCIYAKETPDTCFVETVDVEGVRYHRNFRVLNVNSNRTIDGGLFEPVEYVCNRESRLDGTGSCVPSSHG
jgi:hypothetical protein